MGSAKLRQSETVGWAVAWADNIGGRVDVRVRPC